MAHWELSAILGNEYGEDKSNHFRSVWDTAQNKISGLKKRLETKQETQGNLERDKLKTASVQTAKEIEVRCATLTWRSETILTTLPDSQLLDLNKGLYQLDYDASKILEKICKGCP